VNFAIFAAISLIRNSSPFPIFTGFGELYFSAASKTALAASST